MEYAGDKRFGPSESSWFAPVHSGAAAPEAGPVDTLRQLIEQALEVAAVEYQMQLDAAGALPPP